MAGEAAHHALEAVRLVAAIVEEWGHRPVPSLRAGGLGARELKRLAGLLEVEPRAAAADRGGRGQPRAWWPTTAREQPAFCPTSVADDWAALDVTQRWADLARAWLMAERAPWLVGTRDETGVLRGALDPTHRRMWVPRLRAAVLGALAGATGRLEVTDVLALLAWRAPRSVPTEHAVRAVLDEASLLGPDGRRRARRARPRAGPRVGRHRAAGRARPWRGRPGCRRSSPGASRRPSTRCCSAGT